MKKILKVTTTIILFMILAWTLFTSLSSRFPIVGIRTYVVRTGSMVPTLPINSVIYTFAQEQYKVGDIITFKRGDIDITHRVISINSSGKNSIFIVKGDANKSADPQKVYAQDIFGSVIFSIPVLGILVSFIKTIPGFLLLVFIPTLIFVIQELRIIKGEIEKETEKKVLKRLESSPTI